MGHLVDLGTLLLERFNRREILSSYSAKGPSKVCGTRGSNVAYAVSKLNSRL